MKRYLVHIILIVLTCFPLVSQVNEKEWPMFRGSADLSGKTGFEFPSLPKLLWSLPTGSRTKSSAVVSDGLIYFGNDKGTLFAISSEGKIKWKSEMGNPLEAPPIVVADKVIIGSSDGILRAVNKITGKLSWSYKTEGQIAGSANVWTSGKLTGIITGSYDYFLHCVDPASGIMIWRLETDNYVNGTPAFGENVILFGGCDGIIRLVDPLTGRERDTINVGVYMASSPALVNGKAYLGDYDGNFYSLDIIEGKIMWRIPPNEGTGPYLSTPAVGNNRIVIGNDDKYLYCYDVQTGKQIWKYRTNGRITGSAVISLSRVLFGSNDGNIYMLSLQDGKKLWSFNAGAAISSSPAVTKDRFYFLTEDGRLLAFGKNNS